MTYLFSVFPLRVAFRLLTVWESFLGKKARDSVIEVGDGDVMLLLDSSWHFDFEPLLQRGKSRGMKVIVVVYDLIPLSHPQFFDRRLLKQFTQWLKMVSAYADGYVTISQTVRDELQEFHSQARPLPSEAFQFFYLGAELKMPKQGLPVRAQLVQTGHERMYLTVGTLEPRKNHKYLLDAFDLLWKQGEKVHLYIIGKVGWKCEDLLERIESHAEYGRRLMFYDNANDAELVACYKAAKAVVFASHVEGFGLPLVEAWQQGTPVYASDIPVFREIGGQDTSFFDLDDPASLAAIIRADQDNEPTVNSEWINWKQSAQQLYDAADRIASIRS
jgi:alpha-1,2-rhamnosyltransferase